MTLTGIAPARAREVFVRCYERFPDDTFARTQSCAGVIISYYMEFDELVGYLSATARSSWLSRVPLGVAVAFESVPTFFMGILLVLVFAVSLGWFPATNGRGLAGLVLPAVTLALAFIPAIARVFRTALLDVLRAEHIRTARAKGLPRHLLIRRHVVANALGTTLNVIGIQAGVLLGGAVVTESVFGWPGIGQLSINAVQKSRTS